MEAKRIEIELYNTEKRYYDLNQTENSSNSFWKITITLCVILILIILFITCYRYIYGKIIYICKRCFTWRNKKNNLDENSFIIKGKDNCCMKRSFLWSNECRTSRSKEKFNEKKHKLSETESCKFKTLLQEKKKLLSPNEKKSIISNNNVDLTKKLFLKLSTSSSHSNNNTVSNQISKKWNNRNLKGYTSNKLCTQSTKDFHENSREGGKSIHFSDTDVKCLVTSTFSNKSNTPNKNEKILPYNCKTEDVNNNYTLKNDTSSKLIEVQFENKNSFSSNMQKCSAYTSKSDYLSCSVLSGNLTDSFSDSVINRSDISPKTVLKKLKRSTHSYTNSMMPDAFNTARIKSEENSVMHVIDKAITSDINASREIKKCNIHSSKIKKKFKSSVDILKIQIKERKNPGRKVKSEDNLTVLSVENENTINSGIYKKNFISLPEKLNYHIESPFTSVTHSLETNEIYDELGILFSQYIKVQISPCRKKYCVQSRNLKRIPHSTRKCQMKFNYYRMYPYDQRPTCNSGNICVDAYDELKLMSTSPSERKNIYQHMFTRRKQYLNQPCVLTS